MKRWIAGVGAIATVAAFVACGGGNQTGPTANVGKSAPGGSHDPSKWPANDQSRCDWQNKPELEVSETAGPGALKPNVRRVFKVIGEGDRRRKVLICREIDTNLDGIKDVVPIYVRPDTEDANTLQNNNTAISNYANNQIAKWVQKGGIDKEWDAYVKKVSEPTLGLDANIKIWQKWYDKYTK